LPITAPNELPKSCKKAKHLPPSAPFSPDFERWMRRHEELKFRLGRDCKAHITLEGAITQASIKRLIDYLEMTISDFPEKIDVSPTQGLPPMM
jgi:hypothetical protein